MLHNKIKIMLINALNNKIKIKQDTKHKITPKTSSMPVKTSRGQEVHGRCPSAGLEPTTTEM